MSHDRLLDLRVSHCAAYGGRVDPRFLMHHATLNLGQRPRSPHATSRQCSLITAVQATRSRASGSAHGFQAVMSSLGPQIQAHAALGLPFTCPLKNVWPAEA
eukprot:scaffold46277_cov40-Phaeocystis_antarctica.AAC.1